MHGLFISIIIFLAVTLVVAMYACCVIAGQADEALGYKGVSQRNNNFAEEQKIENGN